MAFFFTLLYLVAAYVTPLVLFGPLSDFHIEIVVVLVALLVTIPNLPGSGLSSAAQAFALGGIFLSIAVSIAQTGWLGGVFGPLYGFMQPVFAFFLVAVNCRKKRHLQWIIVLFTLGSMFFMIEGLRDFRADVRPSDFFYDESGLRRLRGLGFVHDPNDFAQLLVSLIPALFLLRRKAAILNILVVGLPAAMLCAGIYFTHSRGALLALVVIVLLSVRRKIGIVPAAVLSAVLTLGLIASGFTGGREVSMDAGADRLDLWYDGLETIKAHPLFGIGLNGFIDRFGITAHNSVIICASELGVVGLLFWVLFIFSSTRMAIWLGKGTTAETPVDEMSELPPHLRAGRAPLAGLQAGSALRAGTAAAKKVTATMTAKVEPVVFVAGRPLFEDAEDAGAGEADRRQMAGVLLLSLAGFLTAGWFLSRALSMWLFMYCGMIYAVSRMYPVADEEAPRDTLGFLLRWSAIVTFCLLLVLYMILRARNIVGR